ncbi:MAG: tetratricopeptide repeat protein [Thermodesulfovibrionales bacterium]|jgi:tetratricopeptide (TPR) repeat protein
MTENNAEKLFHKGLDALTEGSTLVALAAFEKAAQIEDNPLYTTYLAFCIARERGQFQTAVTMCETAIAREPHQSAHYFNLGKIYLLARKKEDAIRIFREGLRREENRQISDELNKLGTRKRPIIPFLKRNNPVNKCLGIVLGRLGIR